MFLFVLMAGLLDMNLPGGQPCSKTEVMKYLGHGIIHRGLIKLLLKSVVG